MVGASGACELAFAFVCSHSAILAMCICAFAHLYILRVFAIGVYAVYIGSRSMHRWCLA